MGDMVDPTDSKLFETIELMEQVFNNAQVAIVVTGEDLMIERINPEFTRIFGYDATEATGDFLHNLIIPEEFRDEPEQVDKQLRKGDRVEFETMRRRKDGRMIHVSCRVSPIIINHKRAGKVTLFSDISGQKRAQDALRKAHDELEMRVEKRTKELKKANEKLEKEIIERKRIEDAFRESEERYRIAIEHSNDGVSLVEGSRHVYVNQRYAEIHGYESAEEVLGKSLNELVYPDDLQIVEDMLLRRQRGEAVPDKYEVRGLRKDGTSVYIEVSSTKTIYQGKPVSLAYLRDISDRKKAEEALKETNRRLEKAIAEANEMAEQAQAANLAKSEFLANMSHEIRTPMNGIIGMMGLALGTNLTREQREYLEMVSTSANSLLAVLNDVLDLSKIESRKMELEEIDFDLRTTVERAAEIVAVKAGEAGLELTCRIRPEVPTALVGDPGRLRQILVNLLGNSIKFTEKGEVGIGVKVEAEEDSSVLLHFMVSDTGIGIPSDMLDTVFESFRQVDGSITRRYEGTGLGLSISKQLVELMGGGIWVESELGKGSTFHFTARFGLSQKDITEALSWEKLDLSGLHVLIVDDNATNRLVFHEMTSLWGLKPTEVADGEQAIAELKRASDIGQPYNLVLLDLQMPDLDGFEVARKIRMDPACSNMEIIMLTSLGMKGDAERCKEIGIGGYLVKPVKQSELLDGIMLAMGHAPAQKKPVITRHSIEDVRRRLKVLLAEDNPVNQKVALKMLEKRGHHVIVASNGVEAIDALTKERFDLILMDVQMPKMDGFEATRCIRDKERQEGGHMPIVAMTAHAMKGDRERCLAAGMDDYVAKPIKPNELFATLERMANKFQDRRQEHHFLSKSQ